MQNEEKVFSGELVIVRAPHYHPVKVTRFYSLHEALRAYYESGMVYIRYDNKAEAIAESGFDLEDLEDDGLVALKERLSEFADDEPIVEADVSMNGNMEFYREADFSEKDALEAAADDDMAWSRVIYAEEGEKLTEFAQRIYDCTRFRHNAPSMAKIEHALGIVR